MDLWLTQYYLYMLCIGKKKRWLTKLQGSGNAAYNHYGLCVAVMLQLGRKGILFALQLKHKHNNACHTNCQGSGNEQALTSPG